MNSKYEVKIVLLFPLQGCWQLQFNKTTRRHLLCISSDVQQHPLVLRQNQAEFNFIQMSSDALWERLLATDSTETRDLQQFLHRRCDCGFTVSTIDSSVPFIFIPKNFCRNMRQNWLLAWTAIVVLFSREHACLLTKCRYIFKTFIKVLLLKKGSCFKDVWVIVTDKQIKKEQKKYRLRKLTSRVLS